MRLSCTGTGLLLSILLLTGCGGAGSGSGQALSKEDYEAAVYELAHGDLAEEAGRLFGVIVVPLSPEQCSDKTTRFHDVLGKIVERLGGLDPPSEIEELHRDFLGAANESVAEVGRAVDDVRDGRLSCGWDLNLRIYGLPSTQRAEQIISEVQARGYLPYLYGQ